MFFDLLIYFILGCFGAAIFVIVKSYGYMGKYRKLYPREKWAVIFLAGGTVGILFMAVMLMLPWIIALSAC